jgi:hypothetical protein
VRVAFDTTVLWGAFHRPAGPNFRLLALAAQRVPFMDAFLTDAVVAEFWWRATQQGVKGPGQRQARVYGEDEIAEFLDVFGVLLEPDTLARSPLGRGLGRFAGLVGFPLGEVLHIITGKDRQALIEGLSTRVPMTFETVDIADLHVIAGAIENGAEVLCTNDAHTLGYDPIGSMRVVRAPALADDLGVMDTGELSTKLGPETGATD